VDVLAYFRNGRSNGQYHGKHEDGVKALQEQHERLIADSRDMRKKYALRVDCIRFVTDAVPGQHTGRKRGKRDTLSPRKPWPSFPALPCSS